MLLSCLSTPVTLLLSCRPPLPIRITLLLYYRCWDEYVRFKNCMIGKLDPDQQIAVLPGPHFLWHIRTRKQAGAFWKQHYAHLGAGATQQEQDGQGQATQPPPPPPVDESKLQPDVTSRT